MPRKAKTEPKDEPKKAPRYNPTRWNDPEASFDPDDTSLEARLWRQYQRQQGKA